MQEQKGDQGEYRPGDKIRIRTGARVGERGTIVDNTDGLLHVQLAGGDVQSLKQGEVTNYSLAARRAWQTMPKRAGRPPIDESLKRQQVSIRIYRELWRELGYAVEQGFMPSREEAVNLWIREGLASLRHPERQLATENGWQNGVSSGEEESGGHERNNANDLR